jgi:hypothetical protein
MACRDWEYVDRQPEAVKDAWRSEAQANARNDMLSRLLCGLCRVAEPAGLITDSELLKWWETHKSLDATRSASS